MSRDRTVDVLAPRGAAAVDGDVEGRTAPAPRVGDAGIAALAADVAAIEGGQAGADPVATSPTGSGSTGAAGVPPLAGTSSDVLAAASRLGSARAQCGSSLREALDDLVEIAAFLDVGPPDPLTVQAMVEAWTAARGHRSATAAAGFTAFADLDPVTGLAAAEYLAFQIAERMRPVSPERRLALRGTNAPLCAVVVRSRLDDLAPWRRDVRLATVAEAVAGAFGSDALLGVLPDGTILVVTDRDQRLALRLDALREVLELGADPSADRSSDSRGALAVAWVEALPDSAEPALERLRGLDG